MAEPQEKQAAGFALVKTIPDPCFGELALLQSVSDPSFRILMKEFKAAKSRAFDAAIGSFEKRTANPPAGLVKLLDVKLQTAGPEEEGHLKLYFEEFAPSIAEVAQNCINTSSPFSHYETTCIMYGVVEGLRSLQDKGLAHGHLHPSSILYDQRSRQAKLFSTQDAFVTPSKAFNNLKKFYSEGKPCYSSPAFFDQVLKGSLDHEVSLIKEDVWALGMVLLELSTGLSAQNFYKSSGFDLELLKERSTMLEELIGSQNSLLPSVLSFMLTIDEIDRPMPADIIENLPPLESIIAFMENGADRQTGQQGQETPQDPPLNERQSERESQNNWRLQNQPKDSEQFRHHQNRAEYDEPEYYDGRNSNGFKDHLNLSEERNWENKEQKETYQEKEHHQERQDYQQTSKFQEETEEHHQYSEQREGYAQYQSDRHEEAQFQNDRFEEENKELQLSWTAERHMAEKDKRKGEGEEREYGQDTPQPNSDWNSSPRSKPKLSQAGSDPWVPQVIYSPMPYVASQPSAREPSLDLYSDRQAQESSRIQKGHESLGIQKGQELTGFSRGPVITEGQSVQEGPGNQGLSRAILLPGTKDVPGGQIFHEDPRGPYVQGGQSASDGQVLEKEKLRRLSLYSSHTPDLSENQIPTPIGQTQFFASSQAWNFDQRLAAGEIPRFVASAGQTNIRPSALQPPRIVTKTSLSGQQIPAAQFNAASRASQTFGMSGLKSSNPFSLSGSSVAGVSNVQLSPAVFATRSFSSTGTITRGPPILPARIENSRPSLAPTRIENSRISLTPTRVGQSRLSLAPTRLEQPRASILRPPITPTYSSARAVVRGAHIVLPPISAEEAARRKFGQSNRPSELHHAFGNIEFAYSLLDPFAQPQVPSSHLPTQRPSHISFNPYHQLQPQMLSHPQANPQIFHSQIQPQIIHHQPQVHLQPQINSQPRLFSQRVLTQPQIHPQEIQAHQTRGVYQHPISLHQGGMSEPRFSFMAQNQRIHPAISYTPVNQALGSLRQPQLRA